MEFLAQIGEFVTTLIAFTIVISIVVSVHEYGHYIVARWVGIHAEVFSLGFGKVLASRTDKRGTVWQIAAIPLGGYVKFLGDKDASSATDEQAMEQMNEYDRRRSFPAAAVWRRALAVAAGPFANFALSITVFAGLAMWQGVSAPLPTVGQIAPLPYEVPLQPGDRIVGVNGQAVESYGDLFRIINALPEPGDLVMQVERDGDTLNLTVPWLLPPLISAVDPLTPANEAGLQAGDLILSVDGQTIIAFEELRGIIEQKEEQPLPIQVLRDGKVLDLTLIPRMQDYPNNQNGFDRRVMIGVHGEYYFDFATITPNPLVALEIGASNTWYVITSSLNGLKHMIFGNVSPRNLSGPIGIARVSGAVVRQNAIDYIGLIAMISTAIGFLNLFPIPVLDGGHLATFVYEALRGRPPNPKFMQVFMTIGLVLVLSLMVFATYNDILRF